MVDIRIRLEYSGSWPPCTAECFQTLSACKDTPATAESGLRQATWFGATTFLQVLVEAIPMETIGEEIGKELMENAVMADSPETVEMVKRIFPNVPEDVLDIARKRGMEAVTNLLLKNDTNANEKIKKNLQQAVMEGTAGIFNRIPKSHEYPYSEKIDKFAPLLAGPPGTCTVSCKKLQAELLVNQVHVGRKPDSRRIWKTCPDDCPPESRESCKKMREVYWLVLMIVKELEKCEHKVYGKIFKGTTCMLIGSMREVTRIFQNDEIDVHLSLSEDYKTRSKFDRDEQILYLDDEAFDSEEFFEYFLEQIMRIVSCLKLPSRFHKFTMQPLNTEFTPCLKCMTMHQGEGQTHRCKHRQDCAVHQRCSCKDQDDCTCVCDCKEFFPPSLARSKVGGILQIGE